MNKHQIMNSEFSVLEPPAKKNDLPEFRPVSVKHLTQVNSCQCCWYNSSTPGCSGKIIEA
jgi:hypothetical protein